METILESEPPTVDDNQDGTISKDKNDSWLIVKEWLLSLSVPKRGLYIFMSLLLFMFQLVLLGIDMILHFVIKDLSFSSQNHTEATLVFLVVSFYWSLLGSVYSLQAGYRKMGFYALLSVFLNLAMFIIRFCYEFITIQYRKEEF
ncbi:cation channel sperm-associated auxiliary subunit TMEM262-like [Osmerus eperlanus]|uniref:cation channel sperm-associated auxiliary subunit TMEM262-like n=1 Tax=Osmerus eperlanus TaxID=29151 RepID=UPI002E116FA2